ASGSVHIAGSGAISMLVKRVVMCVRAAGLVGPSSRATSEEHAFRPCRYRSGETPRCRPNVRIYAAGVPATGTLTLLFTDLVGSTESLVALGEDRFDSVRDEHDVLVGGTIRAPRGEVVKSTGDGYMAAFHQAVDAVEAAE